MGKNGGGGGGEEREKSIKCNKFLVQKCDSKSFFKKLRVWKKCARIVFDSSKEKGIILL